MIIARDYQKEAVNSIFNYFMNVRDPSRNPVVAMPTGTGKSVVIAMFLYRMFQFYSNQRAMVLTHVQELIEQDYGKLVTLWPDAPVGVYSSGLKRKDTFAPITFGGIASVVKNIAVFKKIDIVIVDEAHLVSVKESTMYQRVIGMLRAVNPNIRVIGFTATPWRLGHGQIIDPYEDRNGKIYNPLFTDFCFDITNMASFNRLVEEGYLSLLVSPRPDTQLDVSGVHMSGGDYIQGELERAVNIDAINKRAIEEAMDLASRRNHWLTFAAGIQHAIALDEILNDVGMRSVVLHSKLAPEDRRKAISGYKAGYYKVLVNNNMLTTGFDFPGIDTILCLRPTQSTPLWVQILGRGTRPVYAEGFDLTTKEGRLEAIHEGGKENCLVLDYASNVRKLGPINDPVVPKQRGKGGGDAPIKQCPVCDCWVHASLRFCNGIHKDGTACTNEFKFETKVVDNASTDEVFKGELPIVEVFKVDQITYTRHKKVGRPDMVRVSHYCGLRIFDEYLGFGSQDYSNRKAQFFWKERGDMDDFPSSTDEALSKCYTLRSPTHLRVWTNKKYPEIMSACYDGLALEH